MAKNKLINHSEKADSIIGCVVGGAVGDALGYPVEFMSRKQILDEYNGDITEFDIDKSTGKALISDDTQMTLFTAAGILNWETMELLERKGLLPRDNVANAYHDWLCTQNHTYQNDEIHRSTFLVDVPEYVEKYYNRYRTIIEKDYISYTNFSASNYPNNDYHKKMLSIVDHRHNINYYMTLSLFDYNNPYESKMADNCMPYGDVDLGFGMCCFDKNADNDTLSLYMQMNKNSERINGATIIENLNEVVEVQKMSLESII